MSLICYGVCKSAHYSPARSILRGHWCRIKCIYTIANTLRGWGPICSDTPPPIIRVPQFRHRCTLKEPTCASHLRIYKDDDTVAVGHLNMISPPSFGLLVHKDHLWWADFSKYCECRHSLMSQLENATDYAASVRYITGGGAAVQQCRRHGAHLAIWGEGRGCNYSENMPNLHPN